MNKLIKELRKALGLTQQEFADKLGISRNTIATYEIGKSEPSGAAFALICSTFGINENWLRTGEGEMFLPINNENDFERVWRQIKLSNSENADFIKRIMRSFWSLSADKQAVIIELINKISEK